MPRRTDIFLRLVLRAASWSISSFNCFSEEAHASKGARARSEPAIVSARSNFRQRVYGNERVSNEFGKSFHLSSINQFTSGVTRRGEGRGGWETTAIRNDPVIQQRQQQQRQQPPSRFPFTQDRWETWRSVTAAAAAEEKPKIDPDLASRSNAEHFPVGVSSAFEV